MALRPLGRTGLKVSPIGLGTVKIGRNQKVKYPRPFDLPDDAAVARLFDAARRLGVNLVDTAPAYGSAEERVGREIARDRDRWVVMTKVGEEFEGGVSRHDFRPEAVAASVARSLARLGTDRLECVLVHSDGADLEIVERLGTLEALAAEKRAGRILSFGMSTKTLEGARAAMATSDVLMLTYNPLETGDGPAIDEACARGVGVVVKKGLVSGHLDRLPGAPADPVEAALAFVFGRGEVASVVVGTLSPEHLEADVRAAARVLARGRP